MSDVATPPMALPEKRIILQNVSWGTYERLLAEQVNSLGTRFAYDGEDLEILVVYAGHEYLNRTLAALVECAAMAARRPFLRSGSTTFKRDELQKGFEPDSSFYHEHAAAVRMKEKIDLSIDPPPDLVIEIDITSDSWNKFPIYSAIGVPEIWRYKNGRVSMFVLRENGYQATDASLVLTPITTDAVTMFLEERHAAEPHEWFDRIQAWVKERLR